MLGDEIDKHYFMNDDWTQDKLYLSVLHILDEDERLLRFVEGMVNVAQLGEGNDTIKEIKQVLEEDGLIIGRNRYVNHQYSVRWVDTAVPFRNHRA